MSFVNQYDLWLLIAFSLILYGVSIGIYRIYLYLLNKGKREMEETTNWKSKLRRYEVFQELDRRKELKVHDLESTHPAFFIENIQHHLDAARTASVTNKSGIIEDAVIHNLLEVAAMASACIEIYGIPAVNENKTIKISIGK